MIQAPIVGANFRPPAQDILQLLPVGTKLVIIREPDNQYDSDAIKVLLPGFSADGPHAGMYSQCVDVVKEFENSQVPMKWGMEQLTDPLHLGYIANSAKTGGKYASELCEWMELHHFYECELVFGASGRPKIQMDDYSPSEDLWAEELSQDD